MNAPFLVSLPERIADDAGLLACCWRGACLQRFAQAEQMIADTLDAIILASDGKNGGGAKAMNGQRMTALEKAMQRDNFGGHAKPALRHLAAFANLHELRCWIAHGQFTAVGPQYRVTGFRYAGKTREDYPDVLRSTGELLQLLADIDVAVTRLGSSLGHIRHICRQRAGQAER